MPAPSSPTKPLHAPYGRRYRSRRVLPRQGPPPLRRAATARTLRARQPRSRASLDRRVAHRALVGRQADRWCALPHRSLPRARGRRRQRIPAPWSRTQNARNDRPTGSPPGLLPLHGARLPAQSPRQECSASLLPLVLSSSLPGIMPYSCRGIIDTKGGSRQERRGVASVDRPRKNLSFCRLVTAHAVLVVDMVNAIANFFWAIDLLIWPELRGKGVRLRASTRRGRRQRLRGTHSGTRRREARG